MKQFAGIIIIVCAFVSLAYGETVINPNTEVSLKGKLYMKKFVNPNTNKRESVPILKLDSPANVAADDYGAAKQNVREIQLAFPGSFKQYGLTKKKYLQQKVIVTGKLQHAIVATQHFTDIFMEVSSINKLPQQTF